LARVTADCPLIDSVIVDAVVDLFCSTAGCAYASNIEPRTYPDGLDVEVFSSEALEDVAAGATDPHDREHVTPAILGNPHRFPSASLIWEEEQLNDVRWTVDTQDDLEFVREVVARLGPRRYTAGMREILETVRQEPSLTDYRGRRG
jgi:spore coat polysaccharide biosynthesis protein SpsF (cytidylyltransferase family)